MKLCTGQVDCRKLLFQEELSKYGFVDIDDDRDLDIFGQGYYGDLYILRISQGQPYSVMHSEIYGFNCFDENHSCSLPLSIYG